MNCTAVRTDGLHGLGAGLWALCAGATSILVPRGCSAFYSALGHAPMPLVQPGNRGRGQERPEPTWAVQYQGSSLLTFLNWYISNFHLLVLSGVHSCQILPPSHLSASLHLGVPDSPDITISKAASNPSSSDLTVVPMVLCTVSPAPRSWSRFSVPYATAPL